MKAESFPAESQSIRRQGRLKEYSADFGSEALQEMLDDFFLDEFERIKEIHQVSRWDDQFEHFDRVIETEDGVKFAPDYTGTSGEKTMLKKAKQYLEQPAVQLHDDEGRVLDPEWLLKVVVPVDIQRWGSAYNRFLVEGGGTPIDHLPNKDKEALAVARHIAQQLQQLPKSLRELKKPKAYIDGLANLARPVQEFFEEQIKVLEEKQLASRK